MLKPGSSDTVIESGMKCARGRGEERVEVTGQTNAVLSLLEACRPKQWIKNGFVLAPLIFSQQMTHFEYVWRACLAFVLFCAYSSAVYLLNDVADIERDRLHPDKRNRPIASGRLTRGTAVITAVSLALGAALISFVLLNSKFCEVGLAYLILNIAYSWALKSIVILDVLTIAAGFVLRVMGGAAVIGTENSDWIYLCTVLLSLFLGLSKRRHEVALLEDDASGHRRILADYPVAFLDQIISAVTGATIVCYCLYTLDPRTLERFGDSDGLKYTIPFVLYGMFRYLFLVYRCEKGGNPTELVLTDRPLMITVIGWVLVSAWAIYGV